MITIISYVFFVCIKMCPANSVLLSYSPIDFQNAIWCLTHPSEQEMGKCAYTSIKKQTKSLYCLLKTYVMTLQSYL